MKKKLIYIIIILASFFLFFNLFTNLKNTIEKKGISSDNMFSNNELELTVNNMIQKSPLLINKIDSLALEKEALFFWYSKEQCSTCVEESLAVLYTLAMNNSDKSKRIIVITPEKENINNLRYKYDNRLEIISCTQKIWSKYFSKLKNNKSIIFILSPIFEVTSAYNYDIKRPSRNKSYIDYLKVNFFNIPLK